MYNKKGVIYLWTSFIGLRYAASTLSLGNPIAMSLSVTSATNHRYFINFNPQSK